MPAAALIVSADANAVKVLGQILEERGLKAEYCADAKAGQVWLAEQRFQAIFLDCRDEAAAIGLIRAAREQPAHTAALIVAIVDSKNEVSDLFAEGASFMLYKPLTAEQTANHLRAAWSMLPGERRRRRRIPAQTRASISYATTEDAAAPILNLSGDGAAILSSKGIPAPTRVYFQFALPGQKDRVRLSGNVVWQDARGQIGLQFAHVPQASRKMLEEWLQGNLIAHASNADARPEAIFCGPSDAQQKPGAERATVAADLPPDRRAQSRRTCRLGVNVYTATGSAVQLCTMTDISAGGCYVETTQPLDAGARLTIELRTLDLKLRVRGKVKSAHRGYGMGVEFIVKTPEEREQLRLLIAYQNTQLEIPEVSGRV